MTDTYAFDLLDIPQIGGKPKSTGMIAVSERGWGSSQISDHLALFSDLYDWAKFSNHVANVSLWEERSFRERVDLYHERNIRCFPGGVTFELAEIQGKTSAFFARLVELGMDAVEISTDVIEPLPPTRRRDLIQLAKGIGLAVFTEVGRKSPEGSLDVGATIDEIQADLDSGAAKVTLENSEIVPLLAQRPDALSELVSSFDLSQIIFEVGPDGFPEVAVSLVRMFGPGINVENVSPDQAIRFDQLRRGMNRDVEYDFLVNPESWT